MCLICRERYSATHKFFPGYWSDGFWNGLWEPLLAARVLLSIITTSSATLLRWSLLQSVMLLQSTLFCNNGFCSSSSQFAITVPGRAAWSPLPEWSSKQLSLSLGFITTWRRPVKVNECIARLWRIDFLPYVAFEEWPMWPLAMDAK